MHEVFAHYFVLKMKVRKKFRKQFPRIFAPMSLDTGFVPTMLSIGRQTFALQQMT